MRILFCSLFFIPVCGFAEFKRSDIDDLKAALQNYATSGCSNEQHFRLAIDTMGKLATPMSSTVTPEQAKANNQLRSALSGVREGLLAGKLGNKASCEQKIKDGIKNLDTLPIHTPPGQLPVKANAEGVSR